MRKCRSLLLLMCLAPALAVLPTRTHAQYTEGTERRPEFERFLSGGVAWRSFAPLPSNTSGAPLDYTTVAGSLGFHLEGFDVQFSYGRYSGAAGTQSSLALNLLYSMDFLLFGGPREGLFLPLLLGADYTRSGAGGMQSEFNVGSIGLGLGLWYRSRGSAVQVAAGGGAIAQYGFAGFRPAYGFCGAVLGDATLLLRRVPVFAGLALGYRVRYQTFQMSDHTLRYHTLIHGPFLGVLL